VRAWYKKPWDSQFCQHWWLSNHPNRC